MKMRILEYLYARRVDPCPGNLGIHVFKQVLNRFGGILSVHKTINLKRQLQVPQT